MPQIVGRTPRYVWGTGTIVFTALCFDTERGDDAGAAVHVTICARRRTVSSGNLTERSSAEEVKVAIDQDVGFTAGSRPRFERRKKGVMFEINVGIVDVRTVIGMRCPGMRYAGDSVRRVPSSVRGSSVDGVRTSRVLAASTGASTKADKAAASVAMRTVAVGEIDDRTEESGIDDDDAKRTSCSATPNSAARKLRKKVSSVFESMLWMKAVFVPLHIDRAPLLDDNEDRASSNECEFLSSNRPGGVCGAADL